MSRLCCLIHLSSFTASISHPSLIVFTPRYLCFGPQGANIVGICTSQTEKEIFISFLSIPQHFLHVVCHYDFSPCSRVHYLLLLPSFLSITVFTCCGTSLSLPPVCFFSSAIPPSSSCGSSYHHFHLFVMQPSFPPLFHSAPFVLYFHPFALYSIFTFLICLFIRSSSTFFTSLTALPFLLLSLLSVDDNVQK